MPKTLTACDRAKEIFESNELSTLCLFVPVDEEPENPIQGLSYGRGLDTDSDHWKAFAKYIRQTSCMPDGKTEALLKEIAENASYGGMAGVILTLTQSTFKEWEECGDLLEACRRDYRAGRQRPDWLKNKLTGKPRLMVGVLDFLNGSGHTGEIDCNWDTLTLPHGTPRVVNNLIDSVFWMVGITHLAKGDCYHNPHIE